MDKGKIKFIVIIIIAAFIIQTIALPLISRSGKQPIENQDVQSGFIQIKVDTTLISYSNSIVVEGPLSTIEEKKQEWMEKGLILSETHITSESTIYNLCNSSVIDEIVPYLLSKRFSVKSEGSFELPETIGNITAGNIVHLKTIPNYPIGSTVTLSITAYVENNEIKQVLEAELMPQRAEFLTNATINNIEWTKVYLSRDISNEIETSNLPLNISEEDNKTVITTNATCAQLYANNITGDYKQKVSVYINPNPAEGLIIGSSIIIFVETEDCLSVNDTLTMNIDAVLYEGSIKRIVKYEID